MKMRKHRRPAFRPSVDIARLEDRVVLSGPSQVAHIQAVPTVATGGQTSSGSTLTQLSRRELYSLYQQQFRAAAQDLKTALSTQVDQLYASGKPSQDQLNNLQTLVIGAVNATAFRVSSQVALLPAGAETLTPRIQDALLAPNRSLSTQLNGIIGYGPFNRTADRLKAELNRTINSFASR